MPSAHVLRRRRLGSSFCSTAFVAGTYIRLCLFISPSDLQQLPKPHTNSRYTANTMCGSDIFLGLIALLFPPLPVW